MAQIQAPATYNNGDTVTAANLNNHVAGAILLPDAIDAQTDRPVLATSDTFLVTSGATLKKVTLANLLKVSPIIGGTTPAAVTATTLASTTLTTSGLATVGSLSVGGTSAHTGAATFASTAAFTGAATFDVAPNFNGGANLGNLDADPVVMTCTLSGNPILSLGSPVTAVAADKILIQDASDASKLKLADFPAQKAKAFVTVTSGGTIVSGSAFNVASVTQTSVGEYIVYFTTPMSSANYVPIVSSQTFPVNAFTGVATANYCGVYTFNSPNLHNGQFSLVIFEV